jgi:hypothetical protein
LRATSNLNTHEARITSEMPLKRTPPPSPTSQPPPPAPAATVDAPVFASATLCGESRTGSEPNLHRDFESDTMAYVTQRNTKRKLDESNGKLSIDRANEETTLIFEKMFNEWSRNQDVKNNAILKTMTEIKEQNSAITVSLDFMSSKYDELLNRFAQIEEEREKSKMHIKSLENRIEYLERHMRSASIEIKNIPKSPAESKTDMMKVVKKIGKIIEEEISTSDVYDVRRINTKTDNKPIILQLSSVIKKENILRRLKQFNKENSANKLNTGHLDYKIPVKPVYITEHITTEARRIFQSCREFSKENHYTFCWIAGGRIYLRKAEGLPAIRIDCMPDLLKLTAK